MVKLHVNRWRVENYFPWWAAIRLVALWSGLEGCYWKGNPTRLRKHHVHTHKPGQWGSWSTKASNMQALSPPPTETCIWTLDKWGYFASHFWSRLVKHHDFVEPTSHTSLAGEGRGFKANITVSSHHFRPPPFNDYQSQRSCQKPKLINFKLNRKLFPIHPTNGFDLEQTPTQWKKNKRRKKNCLQNSGFRKKERGEEEKGRKEKKSQTLIRSNYSLFISNMMK